MTRKLPTLLAALALAPLCVGVSLAVELSPVVRASSRFSKHVLFVCDVSASMYGRPFDSALSAFKMVASQPVDDMQVSVIAFSDTITRWAPSKKTKWAKLPSKTHVKAADKWLRRQGPGGGTNVVPAMELALKETTGPLTIVLVTDGIFSEDDDDVVKAITKGQAARKKAKKSQAVISVLGIGTKRAILERIAKDGKGGYYRTAK